MSAAQTEAARALAHDPSRAERLCRELLASTPGNIEARVILAEALRRQGQTAAALSELEQVAASHPDLFAPHRMIGGIHYGAGRFKAAVRALRRASELQPLHPHVWRELGDALGAAGDAAAAGKAYLQHATRATPDPRLAIASDALRNGLIDQAQRALEPYVVEHQTDVIALILLAEAQARVDRPDLAEETLRRVLALAPDFSLPVYHLSALLAGLGRFDEARDLAKSLAKREPANLSARALLADMQGRVGDHDKAIELYRSVIASSPSQAGVWINLGHALNTVNRAPEAIEAYHTAITLAPQSGEAHWSLANLKSYRFSDNEIAQMETQSKRRDLSIADRVSMGYALGRAYELRGDAEQAFARYSAAAKLYRATVHYDPAELSALAEASRSHFSKDFFANRSRGSSAPDPIFIVGLPRSGSTLVEQILASHSKVEGTMELPALPSIARSLTNAARGSVRENYVAAAAALGPEQATALGEKYLQAARIHRKQNRAFFIDKMPNNFQHIGLIQLLLPRAKIVDVRRHPMACGWSCFKQHFGVGQYFTYDLTELGLYYRDYVSLMAHYDVALPGRVHRVIYENLVSNPEGEIRRLLDYCGLDFESPVLSFHQNPRAIRTPSAEQVRRPINTDGTESWRAYEAYLWPLRDALGPALSEYPSVAS